jgi:hypothetical protein
MLFRCFVSRGCRAVRKINKPRAAPRALLTNPTTFPGLNPAIFPSQILQIRCLATHASDFANPSPPRHRAPSACASIKAELFGRFAAVTPLAASARVIVHPSARQTVWYTPLHMAQKKSAKPHKATLDKILSTVERGFTRLEGRMERGFAAAAEDIGEIKTDIADIKSTMPTTKETQRISYRDQRELSSTSQRNL